VNKKVGYTNFILDTIHFLISDQCSLCNILGLPLLRWLFCVAVIVFILLSH